MCNSIDITGLLSIILTIIGIIVAFVIYLKQKKSEDMRHLAQQIALFYKEEAIMIEEIKKCRDTINQNKTSTSVNAIKREFREQVQMPDGTRIVETEKSVARYF